MYIITIIIIYYYSYSHINTNTGLENILFYKNKYIYTKGVKVKMKKRGLKLFTRLHNRLFFPFSPVKMNIYLTL